MADLEREAFELWAAPKGYNLARLSEGGEYSEWTTANCWIAWKAAKARLSKTIETAPIAIMDTRDVLGICAPKEDDFPALYALQGKRVKLVLVDDVDIDNQASAPPVSVPKGWWLAPEEPSDEMASIFRADAASTTFLTHTTLTCGDFSSRYSAMRAAAPKPDGGDEADPMLIYDDYNVGAKNQHGSAGAAVVLVDAHKMVSALARFHAYFRDRCEYLFAEFGMEAVNLYNEASAELRTHAAEAAKTAKVNKNDKWDAERYRALVAAMEAEYAAVKAGPAKRAQEWLTIYSLLKRLRDAAIDAAMARGE